ncbi:hypothetical protein ACFDR9_001353 [Janthinobacterium sp. CG_23.3]|uniref:hypothetical protein n=1 Tax=Janthinobacterium sp. CG_23.3 TaxID=3349634 RepID=UPI0038D3DC46
MRFHRLSLIAAVALSFSSSAVAERKMESVYTEISGRACKKTVDEMLIEASTSVCHGVGGFNLHVLEDDERSSVDVVAPNKKIFPLEYWDVVTHGFSSLGERAEWRGIRENGTFFPMALIVRVNVLNQDDLDQPKSAPLLAVAKVSKNAACVVGKIDALLADANQRARTLADHENVVCLKYSTEPRH